ncbi:MAG: peptide chain release factor N(5)-glutamine methyltransferase [Taibaiella sp.]|nr:peptide chain release factor N(5)-glutamine methyltransferase [Taibaiella sp.]
MLSFQQAFFSLRAGLQPLYDEREATAIAHGVVQHITGLDKIQRVINKDNTLNPGQQAGFDHALAELQRGMPLQYVTGTAWFMGRDFFVNSSVLIPRPETEELVQWVITDVANTEGGPRIADIGTGSGCIAISIQQAIAGARVCGWDVSGEAIKTAQTNAAKHKATTDFIQADFLDERTWEGAGEFDVIISNPPYIPLNEKNTLHVNVAAFEPATALFVPEGDALLFYRALAAFGRLHLAAEGAIYCELDAAHAGACKILFEKEGYSAVLRQDIHSNWRMLKATRRK